jgi:hypothetical protein
VGYCCNLKIAQSKQYPNRRKFAQSGTDVKIFEIFLPQNLVKKLAFWAQYKAKLCKILIIALGFEKNANFFAENCQQLQKIVILT